MVGLLRVSVALQDQQQGTVEGGLALLVDRAQPGLDVGPDLRPELARGLGQAIRVLEAEGRAIGIVVEEGDLRPPAEPHLEARGEQDPGRHLQRLRPPLRRAQRRLGPVLRPHQGRHLAVADEDLWGSGRGLWQGYDLRVAKAGGL